MCILCVIQKWSRRVATMLPWLVIPLIGLWALSQLLPPAFRFEITSPRLACVFVLLITLFWYEILMPQLSAWRVRRNAQLRERKRFEAIELQKLRKTATRRCRNCLTPYRDQNPGAGKFMCSYCGHVSKRPVLDLPVPPGLGISNSGIIKELVGKGGNILNGKAWSDNGWMCSQDWLENGNWVGASIGGKPSYWQKSGNGSGIFGGDEDCLAENSYSRVVIFACKLLTSIFLCIRWLWRKIFRISSSNEDGSSDVEHRGMLPKRGENGENFHESRGEKTRRKAEEKRQARIERELLEEEERKQREEVARLVEERRKLRDEKMEAERERSKSSLLNRERESKKDAEKKRQERRKEKDKGSSKSNSDVEELERRAGKESDRKKTEADHREHQKSGSESVKGSYLESGRGTKNSTGSNLGRGSAGTRYLDRMKGTFLSSSRALSGSGFFGKSYNAPVNVTKEIKFNSPVDHVHTYAQRRDLCHQEHQIEKPFVNGDDKNLNRPVLLETQPMTLPKKSWQQLFTRSSVTPANSNPHVISRPNSKLQAEFQSPPLSGHSSPIQSFDNPINFAPPSPFTVSSYLNVSSSSSLGFSPPIEPIYSPVVDNPPAYLAEEPELFEDPCYDPDPISLLGPVSESLVNFQMDRGTGFSSNREFERPCALNSLPTSPEVSKPSPIVSPLSRLRVADEKHGGPNLFSYTPNTQDLQSYYTDNSQLNEKGSWQMWKSSPLGQDGPGCWLLPNERKSSTEDDIMQPASQKTMASLFSKDDQIVSGTRSPQTAFLGNGQNSALFSPVNGSSDNDPWVHSTFFPPLSGSDNHFPAKSEEESKQNELAYRSPTGAASSHAFELPPTNWSKRETPIHGSGDGIGKTSVPRANIGGLFPSQDVKSVWSYDSRKGESDSVRDLKYLL